MGTALVSMTRHGRLKCQPLNRRRRESLNAETTAKMTYPLDRLAVVCYPFRWCSWNAIGGAAWGPFLSLSSSVIVAA